jgi:hypothetical protein
VNKMQAFSCLKYSKRQACLKMNCKDYIFVSCLWCCFNSIRFFELLLNDEVVLFCFKLETGGVVVGM